MPRGKHGARTPDRRTLLPLPLLLGSLSGTRQPYQYENASRSAQYQGATISPEICGAKDKRRKLKITFSPSTTRGRANSCECNTKMLALTLCLWRLSSNRRFVPASCPLPATRSVYRCNGFSLVPAYSTTYCTGRCLLCIVLPRLLRTLPHKSCSPRSHIIKISSVCLSVSFNNTKNVGNCR